MYSASDLRVGKKFLMNGEPYEVVNYAQKVVGRGGSIITVKAKNLISGATLQNTFSDKDMFEEADVVTRSYEYLYHEGGNYYFMNQETYDQVELTKDALDGAEDFLTDGDKVQLQEFNGKPINVYLEPSVVLVVESTPPGEKGDTATGGKKPATLNTGMTIQVPLFIENGESIKVDTRTKEYMGRA